MTLCAAQATAMTSLANGVGDHALRAMRIALVIDTVYAWNGGTEKQLHALICALDRRYFQPELYLLRPSAKIEAADFPCPVHVISQRGRRFPLLILSGLISALRRQRPHIVHNFFKESPCYGSAAARVLRVPVIVNSLRNVHWADARYSRALMRIADRLGNAWQCNSRAVWESLTAAGVSSRRVHILPNVVDLAQWIPATHDEKLLARAALGLSESAPVFVMVAHLRPGKDHATLIRAAAMVRERLPESKFLLVGEGPLQAQIKKQIETEAMEATVLLAGVRADVRPFLAAADIGLLSSFSEGSSNAVVEYMATGLPCVVSDIPANRQLVEGLFFSPGDAEGLAREVVALWNDSGLRERMALRNRQIAQQYGREAFSRRAQAFYCMLIGTS